MDSWEKMDKRTFRLFDGISRRAGKAIVDYKMIDDGDKIIVGVSGGKDSLTLLSVLLHRRSIAPVDFEIMAVHIDNGLPGVKIDKLEEHFKSLGVAYHIEHMGTFRGKDVKELNCFWCSWNRRKALFQFADRMGFRKIALAHNLDDIVESILMNQFFKGEISAMCPKQVFFEGKLAIIRPLALEKEAMITRFARSAGFNLFETCRCPVSDHTQRAAIKKMLKEMEQVTPAVKTNIFRSLQNIKTEYLLRQG